jgi:hypothetical protein
MSLAVRCLGGSVDDVVGVEDGEVVVDEFKGLLANVVGDGWFRED